VCNPQLSIADKISGQDSSHDAPGQVDCETIWYHSNFGWWLTGSQHIATAVSAVYVSHRWNTHKLQSSIACYAGQEEPAAKLLYLVLGFQLVTLFEAQVRHEQTARNSNGGARPLTLLHMQVIQGWHM